MSLKEMFVIALIEGAGGVSLQQKEEWAMKAMVRADLTARRFPGSADVESQEPELNQKPVVESIDSTARNTSRL